MFLTLTIIASVLALSNFLLAFYVIDEKRGMFILSGVFTATVIGSFLLGNDWWIAYLVLGGLYLTGIIVSLIVGLLIIGQKTSS